MAHIIYGDPSVLDEVCLKLDYPVGKVPCTGKYWPHLAHNLGAKEQTRLRFQQKSGYTPSVRMFAYLAATSPDFTVDKLKTNLGSIERDDLVSKLEKSSVKGKNITSTDRGKVQYYCILGSQQTRWQHNDQVLCMCRVYVKWWTHNP